jgi:hypothetical protein
MPGVADRHHENQFVGHQLAVLDAAVGQPCSDHADLGAAFGDPIHDGAAVADQERDRDVRKLLLEAADERRQHVLAGNGARGHEQIARQPALEAVHGLERLALELEHTRGVREEEAARARGLRSPAEPVEQPHTQLLLERADVLGNRRLGEEQRQRSLREGLELCHLDEDFELPQIHGAKYRRGTARCLPGGRERTSKNARDVRADARGSVTAAAAPAAAAASGHAPTRECAARAPQTEAGQATGDTRALAARARDCCLRARHILLEFPLALIAAVLVDRHDSPCSGSAPVGAYWPPRWT